MVLSIVVFSLAAGVEVEAAVDMVEVEVETRETRLGGELDNELDDELALVVVDEGD